MKREPRNGLRPITVNIGGGEAFEAYFHNFNQEGSLEDGIGEFAVVELMDGTVKQVDAYVIKFEDVES